MGTFAQRISIAAVEGPRFKEVEAMVDTGATYTWVPRPILEELGVTPEEEATFVLADGREVAYPIAPVRVKINGKERYTICIVGEGGTEPLLGSYTLEGFGLAVDPVNKRLVPARGYLLRGQCR